MVVDAMRVDLRIGSAGYTDMDKLSRGSRVRLGRRRPMPGLVWFGGRAGRQQMQQRVEFF